MFTRNLRPVLLALSLGTLLAACGGGDSAVDPGTGGGGGGGGTTTGTASLTWLPPPTQNTDGSSVMPLAGYRIYRGTSASSLSLVATISSPGITSHVVENLSSGTHYFAVSAYTSGGAESDRSATATKTIP